MADKMADISDVPDHLALHESDLQSNEKKDLYPRDDAEVTGAQFDIMPASEEAGVKNELEVTEDDLQELEEKLAGLSVEHTIAIATELWHMHKNDQNFPQQILDALQEIVTYQDAVLADPAQYGKLIREVKLECILATENSPYLEVRANTEITDDPNMPCMTFRAMVIGTFFAAAGSFIDTLFGFRQPPVYVGTSVGQLIAYPAGKFFAKVLPKKEFRMFGQTVSLNPGPFNRKEHMLITIMCNVSMSAPYTAYIVPAQALPGFFDQAWARERGYQFLNTLGINFVGYGMAGLTRRFLVWPAFAVWPGTLANMALVKAFHAESNEPVRGPFGRMYTASREKFFLVTFFAMVVYYFFPGFIFTALSSFSWISWIAPNNTILDAITGMNGGVGINPWPTFDWNIAYSGGYAPLTLPSFTAVNLALSLFVSTFVQLGIWFKNMWNTAYLPINSPSTFNNLGMAYDVTQILTDGKLDDAKYQTYSQPWMTAGTITAYIFYFTLYSATVTYILLFHRYELATASKGFWRSVRKTWRRNENADEVEDMLTDDIHARLMRQYKDVPEWVYLIVLLVFAAIGMIGVGIYPSETSPVVMVFGIIMTLITLLPVGLVQSVTGVPVPTNVIAEFIGGSFVEGNANALMYFKTYGYISCYQAMAFSNDLKLAHYSKLPPWHTFTAQMWATLVFSIVSASVFNLAMGFRGVCTRDAVFDFTCPGQTQYFTAAVFWGTLSPKRLFGPGNRYNTMLIGFPAGVIVVLIYWAMRKRWPKWALLRQVHPVMLCQGPIIYASPYNISYMLPFLYTTVFSFQFIRKRYTQFWAKYNYVLAASFPSAIAVTAVIIFFGLDIPKGGLTINWWGNTVEELGCEGQGGCPLLPNLPAQGFFGPPKGQFT